MGKGVCQTGTAAVSALKIGCFSCSRIFFCQCGRHLVRLIFSVWLVFRSCHFVISVEPTLLLLARVR